MSKIFADNDVLHVLDVIREEVDWFFGEWPEDEGIGTSDVGACYRAVVDKLGSRPENVTDAESTLLMNGIHNEMHEVLASR